MTPAVVICLHCRKQYALRLGRLRVMQNDVCPRCGYVGWSYVETCCTPSGKARRRPLSVP